MFSYSNIVLKKRSYLFSKKGAFITNLFSKKGAFITNFFFKKVKPTL